MPVAESACENEPVTDRKWDLSRVDVIIPVHNEEQSLPLVLRDLPAVGRVIVVDNASTDRSSELAWSHGAVVVREPKRGYGAACLAGLAHINSEHHTCGRSPEIVVFLDGDYSDYPEELCDLVQPILEGHADFVLGSRLSGVRESGAMPPQSVYGNKLACFLMRWIWGVRYTDLGPFRAIRWDSLQSLGMQDQTFGWTVEMQIKARQHQLRMLEVPVRYRRRIGTSKISGTIQGTIRAGYKILYTIARYWWQSLWTR